MITQQNIEETITSASFQSKGMGVVADSRMFNLLLKNLYTDPVGSMVRELCTNAVDAHVSVGNTNPYHIQLPSRYDYNFILRDFGPGLDDKEIDKYLNTLFSSSKSESNEQAGGYGIGSKVPFALVDSFNIESYKNGMKYSGLWYRESCGKPNLIVTDISTTTQPNGLKFVVTCNPNDVSSFADAVQDQLFHFNMKPVFFSDIDDPKSEYQFAWANEIQFIHDNLKVYHVQNHRSWNNRISVGVGGVNYSLSDFRLYEKSEKIANFLQYLAPNSSHILVIDVPIGCLTIPLNRESIETSEENLQTILKYSEKACEDALIVKYQPLVDILKTKHTYTDFIKVCKDQNSVEKNCSLLYPNVIKSGVAVENYFPDYTSDKLSVLSGWSKLSTYSAYKVENLLKAFLQCESTLFNVIKDITRYVQELTELRTDKNGNFRKCHTHCVMLNQSITSLFLVHLDTKTFTTKALTHHLDTVQSVDLNMHRVIGYKGDIDSYRVLVQFLKDLMQPFGISVVDIKMSALPKAPRTVKVPSAAPVAVVTTPRQTAFLGLRKSTNITPYSYNIANSVKVKYDDNDVEIPLGIEYTDSNTIFLYNEADLGRYGKYGNPVLERFAIQYGIKSSFIATEVSYAKYLDLLSASGLHVIDPEDVYAYYETSIAVLDNNVFSDKEAILELFAAASQLYKQDTSGLFLQGTTPFLLVKLYLALYANSYDGLVINQSLDAYVRANLVGIKTELEDNVIYEYARSPHDVFKNISVFTFEREYIRIAQSCCGNLENRFDIPLFKTVEHISDLLYNTKVYKQAIRLFISSNTYSTPEPNTFFEKILVDLGLTWTL